MLVRNSISPQLKVGILIEPDQLFESWEIAVFERIAANPSFSLSFIQANSKCPSRSAPALQRWLISLEQRFFCPGATANRGEIPENLTQVPLIFVEKLADLDDGHDILISHIAGQSLQWDRGLPFDVWEYHFNIDGQRSSASLGMRAVLDGRPSLCMALFRRSESGDIEIVGSCHTNTKFSGAFTAHYARAMLPSLVERSLIRWHLDHTEVANDPGQALREIAPLNTAEVIRYGLRVAKRAATRAAYAFSKRLGGEPHKWSLVLNRGDILRSPIENLMEIPQPKGEYRADPFLFRKANSTYIFYESWNGSGASGKIHVGILDGHEIRDIQPLDFGDIHLSYPYVFEHEGEILMMPETHQRERIEVWRCTEFPAKWELHATALEGCSPVDSCLLHHSGDWWLLTNLSNSKILDHCMELHAFKVDGPALNVIAPHALNPVVLDTSTGRNAGRPFVHDGKLIRPAQSSHYGLYGYDLRLMEITELSIDAYKEAEIRRIEPDERRSTTGCHHLDVCGDLSVLDARRAFGARAFGAREIALKVGVP